MFYDMLLFTLRTETFANPSEISFMNEIRPHRNYFLTYVAVSQSSWWTVTTIIRQKIQNFKLLALLNISIYTYIPEEIQIEK